MSKKNKKEIVEENINESNEIIETENKLNPEMDTVKDETRGAKANEVKMESAQNKAKELVLMVRKMEKQKLAAGKSSIRLYTFANQLERMIKTHLID